MSINKLELKPHNQKSHALNKEIEDLRREHVRLERDVDIQIRKMRVEPAKKRRRKSVFSRIGKFIESFKPAEPMPHGTAHRLVK
jgi:predicted  nucleic acid-binding Zn-ribbon protein